LLSAGLTDPLAFIKEYYREQDIPQIGDKFVVNIIKRIETLLDNPEIGRKVPEFNEENIRELIHLPFRIVYLRDKEVIHVIRVWRSERLLALEDRP